MRPTMRSALLLLALLGLLASCDFQSAPTPEKQIKSIQSVRIGDSSVIGLTMPRNITSQRMVIEARRICQGRNPCVVLGSFDQAEIPMAMAQPERQALIKEFRYGSKGDKERETVEVNCQYYPEAEPEWCSN